MALEMPVHHKTWVTVQSAPFKSKAIHVQSSNEVPGEQASTVSDESSVSPIQEQSSTHTLSSNEVPGEQASTELDESSVSPINVTIITSDEDASQDTTGGDKTSKSTLTSDLSSYKTDEEIAPRMIDLLITVIESVNDAPETPRCKFTYFFRISQAIFSH